MKILIIEDDPIKLAAVKNFLKTFTAVEIVDEKMSYQAGLLAILRSNYDLILLDMQLPNYDVKSGEDGYKLRPIAGRDILREVKRKKVASSVIVVTQYEGFGENGKFSTLEEWHKMLKTQYSGIYKMTIRYKPGSNSWKDELRQYLNNKINK